MIVSGKVIKRSGRGRKFGFPTANIEIGDGDIADGVYASIFYHKGKTFPAISTVSNRHNVIENHVVGFKDNLYGRRVTFDLRKKIKDVETYRSMEEMVESRKRLIAITEEIYRNEKIII